MQGTAQVTLWQEARTAGLECAALAARELLCGATQ